MLEQKHKVLCKNTLCTLERSVGRSTRGQQGTRVHWVHNVYSGVGSSYPHMGLARYQSSLSTQCVQWSCQYQQVSPRGASKRPGFIVYTVCTEWSVGRPTWGQQGTGTRVHWVHNVYSGVGSSYPHMGLARYQSSLSTQCVQWSGQYQQVGPRGASKVPGFIMYTVCTLELSVGRPTWGASMVPGFIM